MKVDPTKSLWRKALKLIETNGGWKVYFYNGVHLGDAIADVDGFYKFWPERRPGSWEAYVLRYISECLDELNAKWEKEIADYFSGQDWAEKELKEAADGFTLDESAIAEFRGESESEPVSDTRKSVS